MSKEGTSALTADPHFSPPCAGRQGRAL